MLNSFFMIVRPAELKTRALVKKDPAYLPFVMLCLELIEVEGKSPPLVRYSMIWLTGYPSIVHQLKANELVLEHFTN